MEAKKVDVALRPVKDKYCPIHSTENKALLALRAKIDAIFDSSYSRALSACPKHTIFQRQKALNEIMELPEIVRLGGEG